MLLNSICHYKKISKYAFHVNITVYEYAFDCVPYTISPSLSYFTFKFYYEHILIDTYFNLSKNCLEPTKSCL